MLYSSLRSGASLTVLAAFAAAPLWAEVPSVVADVPVAHSLTAMVMGDLGTPELLLDRGADPHHFQLRPSQARAVAHAGLVVWMGPEMAPWMERAVASLSEGKALNLLAVEGLHLQPFAESRLAGIGGAHAHDHAHGHASHGHDDDAAHGHGHHDEHEHGHGEGNAHAHDRAGHDHEGHDHAAAQDDGHGHRHDDGHAHGHAHGHRHHHGDVDPHAWMKPANAAIWLEAIADSLAALDPDNADTYRDNAASGIERVAALEEEVAAILAPVGDAGLVMYHDAYGYLATAFGLNILGTIALGDAADPGAARLSAIRANLREAGAICVFPEVNHPDAYVALITAGEDSVRIGAPLDPEGVMLEPGPDLYPTLMLDMARAIADCVTGG